MRIVGHRTEPPITFTPTSNALKIGARMCTDMQAFPGGKASGMLRNNVFHFKTHEDAHAHWENCLIQAMVQLAVTPHMPFDASKLTEV